MTYRGTETEEKYLDLWIFSYLCNGINFMDMLFLRYANVSGGEICFVRAKTSASQNSPRVIRAVMTDRMKRILERWGNEYTGNPETFSGTLYKKLRNKSPKNCGIIYQKVAE